MLWASRATPTEITGQEIEVSGHNWPVANDVIPPGVSNWDFPRSVASVALMAGYAVERGVAESAILHGTGLEPSTLADPDAQIDARVELAVVRNLARELGDEAGLGLHLGSRYRVTTFGLFGFACVSSPTLWDAISFALRYLELSFTFCLPSVHRGAEEIVGNVHDEGVPADVRRLLVERDLTAMYVVLTDLVGDRVPLRRLELRADQAAYADEFVDVFGVEPEFGCPANVFGLDPAQMNRPLPQANQHTLTMCETQCRELVARRRARTGIAHEVRERLVNVGGAPAGIDEVARSLNMSVRTLRRRLTEAGTSYRDLLDEVRHALAEELLSTTPLSVSDVAIRLGYAEAASLIYAFKRWSGTTPAAYQRTRQPMGVRRSRGSA